MRGFEVLSNDRRGGREEGTTSVVVRRQGDVLDVDKGGEREGVAEELILKS